LPPEDLADEVADQRDARRATHEDHAVDLVRLHLRVAEGAAAGHRRATNQVGDQGFDLGARNLHLDRAVGERQGGDGVLRVGEGVLRLAGGGEGRLHREGIGGQVAAQGRGDLLEERLGQGPIEVVAAEGGVTRGALHLEDALYQLEDGDVEGPAAEV